MTWICRIIVMFLAVNGLAQGLDNSDLLYTVGTTSVSGKNTWAFITWQAGNADLVIGRTVAIYSKAGAADSANSYRRVAIVSPQSNPTAIQTLLQRGTNLGDNLAAIAEQVDAFFGPLIPAIPLSLSEKLSIVFRSGLNQPKQLANVVLLERLHPAVALALGLAYTQTISATGKTTFEVREFDSGKLQDLAVIGRVTVDPVNPLLLPAPTAPVQVPGATPGSPGEHLNMKFRWGTDAPLRRLSLLNYGFNLYRVEKAFAVKNDYQLQPPDPAVLRSLAVTDPTNGPVHLVNKVPILKSKDFTSADVDPKAGDSTTFFIADDQHRFEPDGQPFADGAEYYYFVTARDILGRDGLVSPGTLAKACSRMPPSPPTDLRVQNEYHLRSDNVGEQRLKLTWTANNNQDIPEYPVTGYYVYRWNTPTEMRVPALDPGTRRITLKPIPHPGNGQPITFVDDTFGAPSAATAGQTFWYTVRAETRGSCGAVLSDNSAPAFGVWRDRAGPVAPTGELLIRCCQPLAVAGVPGPKGAPLETTKIHFSLNATRKVSDVSGVEFYLRDLNPTNRFARAQFDASGRVVLDYAIAPADLGAGPNVTFVCLPVLIGGLPADAAFAGISSFAIPSTKVITAVPFDVGKCDQTAVSKDTTGCVHAPRDPATGTVAGVQICVKLAADTHEYRIYRREDNGDLHLVTQGQTQSSPVQVCYEDTAVPAAVSGLCYYAQGFDEHGNPSALVPMGCTVSGDAPMLPVPMLLPITPEGTATAPQMRIRWFCSPYNVERFEVNVALEGSSPPGTLPDDLVRIGSHPSAVFDFTFEGTAESAEFTPLLTDRIGPAFGNGGQFSVIPKIGAGTYIVFVRAVGRGGILGERSNVQKFQWTPPAPDTPLVPWPERALPRVSGTFNSDILAIELPDSVFQGAGVRIGFANPITPADVGNFSLEQEPDKSVYRNGSGSSLLPMVLYRHQVPSAAAPVVSGDLIQVSPMMEKIAYALVLGKFEVRDPFVRAILPTQGTPAAPAGIYLIDTQPIIEGATYEYFLVRFGPDMEIAEVIPSNTVEVRTR